MLPISPYVPPAPTNLQAAPISTSQITLSWTETASDVRGFKLEMAPPGKSFYQFGMISATRTNCIASGLAAQSTYSFRVRAYNAYGNGPYSNTATTTTD
jgi:hypothetical protein